MCYHRQNQISSGFLRQSLLTLRSRFQTRTISSLIESHFFTEFSLQIVPMVDYRTTDCKKLSIKNWLRYSRDKVMTLLSYYFQYTPINRDRVGAFNQGFLSSIYDKNMRPNDWSWNIFHLVAILIVTTVQGCEKCHYFLCSSMEILTYPVLIKKMSSFHQIKPQLLYTIR